MSVKTIDAAMLRNMFLAGAKNLEANREWIDELNVFPVPDGDTGTNMTMTVMSAVNEVSALKDPRMPELCKAISKGSLRGARGNSGVIMSQLLRGFTRGIQDHDTLDINILIDACEKAVDIAYKAVMKPKEGTILTVARGVYEKAAEYRDSDIDLEEFIGIVLDEGDRVLAYTPELLPVLKEAGVVDSGGTGLITVLKGAYDFLCGKEIDLTSISRPSGTTPAAARSEVPLDVADIKFGYCTEFIILLEKPVPKGEQVELKAYLDSKGDSIVMVADDDLIKIHVHTNEPGKVLQKALTFGELTRIKIDNMREEHRELLGLGGVAAEGAKIEEPKESERAVPQAKEPPKKEGFITVCAGTGFKEIFEGLAADVVIEGGQTMNPSTDDFMKAIESVNAENVFIFPNNKNIIMAANQARDLTADKKVFVIPTKTIPQGISAILCYDGEASAEDNEACMLEAVENVATAEITYAIRNTHVDGFEIHEGDIMSVGDKGLLCVENSITDAIIASAEKLVNEETEIISLYIGEEFSQEDADKAAAAISEKFSSCDVDVQYGGQPVYYCIMSVE